MRQLLSREPVRVYLYGLALTLVALLVAYGVVDAERAPLWLAGLAAGLSIPAIESARARVSPVADVNEPEDVTAAGRPVPRRRRQSRGRTRRS